MTVCVYGGVGNKRDQGRDLAKGCHVVVGTPGRLNDFVEGKELYLSNVSKLVVDEADRMLDMGFEPQIRKAVKEVKEKTERQTLFFTATWNANVQKIAAEFVNNPFQASGMLEVLRPVHGWRMKGYVPSLAIALGFEKLGLSTFDADSLSCR